MLMMIMMMMLLLLRKNKENLKNNNKTSTSFLLRRCFSNFPYFFCFFLVGFVEDNIFFRLKTTVILNGGKKKIKKNFSHDTHLLNAKQLTLSANIQVAPLHCLNSTKLQQILGTTKYFSRFFCWQTVYI